MRDARIPEGGGDVGEQRTLQRLRGSSDCSNSIAFSVANAAWVASSVTNVRSAGSYGRCGSLRTRVMAPTVRDRVRMGAVMASLAPS